MSRQDVDELRIAWDAYSRGDLERAFQAVHPEFEVQDHMIPEASAAGMGADALLANRQQVGEAFSDLTYEPLEFIDLQGRILVRVRGTGKGRHTGLAVAEETGQLWTLRDGLAVRLDVYRTWREARYAAGLDD